MGSSAEPNANGIDASVGGLVWVRRRNGSWWPGKIVGLDEVSESCLVSPRLGTPVKLLGRKDASVDWYNLEKSKRVKAFRCGEYDECIEKAKAAAANSNKKAIKYARRDVAILHALELESARLGKESLNFCSRAENSGSEHDTSTKESPIMSHSGNGNKDLANDLSDSEEHSNMGPELTQSGISFQDPMNNSPSQVQPVRGRRRRTPNDSEDDGTERVKRMRGLEDLGMGVGSKRNLQPEGARELVHHSGATLCNSNMGNCLENGISANGGGGYISSMKRKRSQMVNVHEYLKRKNRHRPLTKVLESTGMVSVPVTCDQLPSSGGSQHPGLSNGKVSGLESTELKKTFPLALANNSESTGVSFENRASSNIHKLGSDATYVGSKLKKNCMSCVTGLPENGSSDKLFDVPFIGEEKHSAGFLPSSDEPQVSSLGQRSCHGSQAETMSLGICGLNESGSASLGAGHVNVINHRAEKGTSKWQLKGKRNSRHTSKSRKHVSRKYADMNGETEANLTGTENSDGSFQGADLKTDCNGLGEGQVDGHGNLSKRIRGMTDELKLLPDGSLTSQRSFSYRQSRFRVKSRYEVDDFPGRDFSADVSLSDVKLEVQASCRPQHVPLVSLMSKLNGKAIIGHPLTVEVLDDGYCDKVLSSHKRVGDACYTVKQHSSIESIPVKKKSLMLSHYPSSTRPLKTKKSGLLSKKTRKLSSLTGHKLSEDEKKPLVDTLKGPVIACIPLRLVFSRINEAVNGLARTTPSLPTTNP